MQRRRLAFVQYGDYAEAVRRMDRGEPETYAAQYQSINFVGGLTSEFDVTVICVSAPAEDSVLRNGVRAIGLGFNANRRPHRILSALEDVGATDVVLATPLVSVLVWGRLRRRRLLPVFADSFSEMSGFSPKGALSRGLMVRLLSSSRIEVVANHNVAASADLVRIGVPPSKVVPWDWPPVRTPSDLEAKKAPAAAGQVTLAYAGMISESKGVGDLVCALAEIKSRGISVRCSFAGDGDVAQMKQLASELGVSSEVDFLGRVPNTRVFDVMREADLVVVPSRPTYPEGLPMTIYEGLCSRSPVLLSDHPMFVSSLAGRKGVRFFRAGAPKELAELVVEVSQNSDEYGRLSVDGVSAWESIQVKLQRPDLLSLWLENSHDSCQKILEHSLTAAYPDRIPNLH